MSLNLLNLSSSENLKLLDWQTIMGQVESFAIFEITKQKLQQPPKVKNIAEINDNYDSLEFFINLLDEDPSCITNLLSFIPEGESNFDLFEFLAKQGLPSLNQLNFICLCLESYFKIRSTFKRWIFIEEYSFEQSDRANIRNKFINKFRAIVDTDGTIHYERHPVLGPLFKKIQDINHTLRNEVQTIARNSLYANSLQFSEHDIINDRFVLAIRSDSYRAEQGPIVAKSSSGLTLFVEPFSIKNKGNDRLHMMAKLEEAIAKIANEFSTLLHQYSNSLNKVKNFLLELDYTAAKALYCSKNLMQRPSISNKFELHLEDFFHPLIENPVTNSLSIQEKDLGLIISGPNTGGKTVTLKVLALMQLFLQHGLFLPCSNAKIYPVSALFYFGNDQQDLKEGLSSFASETENYLQLLSQLDQDNLIIVDEIFNSTSSEEASSLAIALLEEIHSKSSSKVIISTHHQFFKTLIHDNEDYISAHVGHDHETNMPTYKIYTGVPGSSMAFTIFKAIADKKQFKSDIPEKASSILSKKQISYDRLLQDLSRKKAELDKMLDENRSLNYDLKNQKKSNAGLLLLEKERSLKEYKIKLDRIIMDSKKVFQSIKKGEISTDKQFHKIISKTGAALNSELQQNKGQKKSKESDRPTPSFSEISVGERYYSNLLDKKVTILSISNRKKTVNVQSGAVTIDIPANSLRLLQNSKPVQQQVQISIQRSNIDQLEHDCRGMRLEPFQHRVESAMTGLLTGNIPYLDIIHGHGDGVLKQWLRNFLKKSDSFRWETQEGNDGHTRIFLI